jgi:predicted O-linked N-acetylglucosamine transferase (SPINDLY family)
VGLLARIRSGGRRPTGTTDSRGNSLEQEASQLLDEGSACEREGRIEDAMRRYEAAIRLAPKMVRAHVSRGTILLQLGDAAAAAEAYSTALVQDPDNAVVHYHLGQAHARSGYDELAVAAYRRAIALQADFADAEVAQGEALEKLGQLDNAMASYDRALYIRPDSFEAHRNLGSVLSRLGRLDDAVASYRRALAIKPDDVAMRNNLGTALLQLGQVEGAVASFRAALEIDPGFAVVHFNLGNALKELAQLDDAVVSYCRALEISPDLAVAHCNLGSALKDLGHLHEAVASYLRAIQIDPNIAIAHLGLGDALQRLRQIDAAVASYRRSLQIDPDCAETHTNLGAAQRYLGNLHDSMASHQQALQIKTDFAEAHNNLGNTLKDLGRFADAAAHYHRALELQPESARTYSNLLLVLNYSASESPEYCLEQARRFGRMLDAGRSEKYRTWTCSPRPARLRIGFVSGDLCNHPVGHFLVGPLTHIDPARVELIAYPTVDFADPLTDVLRPRFAAWNLLSGKDDDEAARLIHADGVHILLDLSGHTANNRLPVFARRPAPVQCSWLGYFATTGVAEMDYLLGDPYVTPAEEAGHFTEQIWRLPECYLCFTPPDLALNVGRLPAETSGHVVFGCFNNLAKMNDAVVSLWARLLQAVPGSRLFLKTAQLNDSRVCEATRHRFAERGIAHDQLYLEGSSPRVELLGAYDRVDIALDPFPYPGGTTSVEALWMGVPVITRKGDRFLSHVGETIAHNAGLADWIAAADDDYLAKAVRLATNLAHLANLRAGLRQQVLASAVFDASCFARHFEEALWGMWRSRQVQQGTSA